jgi:hypothetical protein
VFDSLALNILVFIYALIAPGVAIAWVALRDPDPVVLGVVGLTVGLFGLPVIEFSLAVILGTHINPPLMLGTATVILAAVAIVIWRRRRMESSGE